MDEHSTMRQWRGDRCHLREKAFLLHDHARARVNKQASSREAEADALSAEARLREREAQFHQAQQAAQQQGEDWQAAHVWRRMLEQTPQGAELQGHAAGEATDAAEAEPEPGPSDGDVATGGPTAERLGRKRGDQPNQSARRKAATKAAAEAARAAG